MIPALTAHLWQSTMFAGIAWLLTLALRKNPAKVRHGVLFIASVKFLIPFSLLVWLGALVPRHASVPPIQSTWITTAEQIGQPLITLPAIATQGATGGSNHDYLIPAAIALWACGFAAIAICWLRRWKRVLALRKSATPVNIAFRVPVMAAPDLIEPGVVGIVRPVLLLPEGIEDRLDPAQLDAVLTHELCHVRRRDNLTATIHMAVQATFWFHPLVWWLGVRLVEECERACDEEVLRGGTKPQIYAEGILNVCKLYVESPLSCVSGVTGSNLKKRIETIMKNRNVLSLSFAKKFALTIAAVAALAVPLLIGFINPPSINAQPTAAATPKFDVASVKLFQDDGGPRNSAVYAPQGINFGGLTLAFIIGEAYQVPVGRMQGPGSLTKEELWAPLRQGYDIVAKANRPVPKDQLRLMLQSLLAERFRLVMHREARLGPMYKLVVAKGGPKLEQAQAAEPFSLSNNAGGYSFRNADMLRLSAFLSGNVDRPVVDQTGLKDFYNFILKRPEDVERAQIVTPQDKLRMNGGISTDSPSAATFGDALKQLGLQLVPDRGAIDYLVIDHLEKPSEN